MMLLTSAWLSRRTEDRKKTKRQTLGTWSSYSCLTSNTLARIVKDFVNNFSYLLFVIYVTTTDTSNTNIEIKYFNFYRTHSSCVPLHFLKQSNTVHCSVLWCKLITPNRFLFKQALLRKRYSLNLVLLYTFPEPSLNLTWTFPKPFLNLPWNFI